MEDNGINNNSEAKETKPKGSIFKNREIIYFVIILIIGCISILYFNHKRKARELSDYLTSWSLPNEDFSMMDNAKYTGFYESDSSGTWINGDASIDLVNNMNTSSFSLIGYYPEIFPENSITVIINDNESMTIDMVPGSFFYMDFKFENISNTVHIGIKTEKTFIPIYEGWNEDTRELGAIIASWNVY